MKRSIVLSALLGGASVLLAGQATAGGDPKAGETKAIACAGCHGIEGYHSVYPTYSVPRVGGQHAQYVIQALKEYREGKRTHPTMRAQASSLSDQDIQDIAAYFESLKAE